MKDEQVDDTSSVASGLSLVSGTQPDEPAVDIIEALKMKATSPHYQSKLTDAGRAGGLQGFMASLMDRKSTLHTQATQQAERMLSLPGLAGHHSNSNPSIGSRRSGSAL